MGEWETHKWEKFAISNQDLNIITKFFRLSRSQKTALHLSDFNQLPQVLLLVASKIEKCERSGNKLALNKHAAELCLRKKLTNKCKAKRCWKSGQMQIITKKAEKNKTNMCVVYFLL